MNPRIKLDPLSYVLLASVIAIQIYGMRSRDAGVAEMLEASDHTYQEAVFDSGENKGVMHQVFRQNEVDRELLKALLHACTR